ncbi:MAG TPA: hypothetical protein VHM30_07590 [Gemmatimonadaceae bacterium]|nr:hypothetical protein [Gemmatimonadaceae bacterium]
MHRLTHWTVLLACAITGCTKHEIVSGVSDSAFVAAMADLRRIQNAPGDSASQAATRQRVLQQRGLTEAQLERAAEALAKEPARATALFEAIERRAVNAKDSTATR